MNFYPFHIGDYAAHTRHLSFMEDLAYRRLIDQYYLDESPLKGEPNLIARRIGMSDFSSDVEYILQTFFEKDGDLWVSKRCDDEITKYRSKADSARNANRIKSEKILALKSEQKSEPNHNVTKNQEPITKNHIKNTIAKPDGLTDLLWKDFLILRKSKKLPVTQTAFDGIAREAKRANKTLPDVIQICCERGWGGFKAEWLLIESLKTQDKPVQKWDATLEGVMNKGRELGILPKPGETEGQYRERVKQG